MLEQLFEFLMEQPFSNETNFTDILAAFKEKDKIELQLVGGKLILLENGTWMLRREKKGE